MKIDDMELVREYAASRSEQAFETLVSRHIDLVYSAALRQVNDPHAAEEVTQAVFIVLSRKAGRLGPGTILPGWLYRTTRYVCADTRKPEHRRRKREWEAHMQSIPHESADDPWEQLAPFLDEAMAKLGEKDRNAVMLHFFEGKSLRDVGDALSASEEAAKKRVQRAIDKLRLFFMRRGVALSSTVIGTALSNHAIHAAPASLAASVAAAAKGSAATTSALGLAKGALKFMAWTKLKTTAVAGVAVLLVAGGTIVAVTRPRGPSADEILLHLREPAYDGYLEKAPPVALVRPTRFPQRAERLVLLAGPPERLAGTGRDFAWDFTLAYGTGPDKLVLPETGWPTARFDFITTVPNDPKGALREEIRKKLGLVAHWETRELDSLVLKSGPRTAATLQPHGDPADKSEGLWPGHLKLLNMTMADTACQVSYNFLGTPILDETGLGGQRYDIDLNWNPRARGAAQREAIARAFREQLGLEASWERRPVEMLVVEHLTNKPAR